jgi:hypothetical protein
MNSKIIVFLAFAIFAIIGLSSCEEELLTTGFSVYYIDNQSSHELIYTGTREIKIDTTKSREIFSIETPEKIGIKPDDTFKDYIDNQGKVYLYREDAGVEIQALNIYLNTDLTWEEEDHEAVDGSHIFSYRLTVTDDMLE